MNTHQDTYEQALRAVSAALDALCADKSRTVTAFDPGDENYNANRHSVASGEHIGALDALLLVTGMISDYRKLKAGAA